MLDRREDVTIQDFIDAIIDDYRNNFSNGEEVEYSIEVQISLYTTSYCRVVIKDCKIKSQKYYYLTFREQSEYDFISSKEIFEKFFEENDNVFWKRCED